MKMSGLVSNDKVVRRQLIGNRFQLRKLLNRQQPEEAETIAG